jgi:hypothetical protein
MTNKPQRPLRKLENVIIDGGEYGAGETEAPAARKRGSPPLHDWSRIDVVLDFYLANRGLLLEEDFVDAVRKWCRDETKTAPHERTLLKRLHKRAQPQ